MRPRVRFYIRPPMKLTRFRLHDGRRRPAARPARANRLGPPNRIAHRRPRTARRALDGYAAADRLHRHPVRSRRAVGVDYDGSAPGETGIVLLQPVSPVETVHGLFLTGGGLFGLGAHAGMIRYLEEQKRGFDWGGDHARARRARRGHRRPRARRSGHPARSAVRLPGLRGGVVDGPVAEGNVGAGAGATVGRMLRPHTAGGMKGGIGTASLRAG